MAAAAIGATANDEAHAFCSTEVILNACDDGDGGHEQMTIDALSFLNDGALDESVDEHQFVDTSSVHAASNHFDNCRFQESADEINAQYHDPSVAGAGGVLAEFNPADPSPLDAADEFGQLLHIAQDFYSHSNWIELGRTDLFEPGTGNWSVADDWKVLRDDIVVVSEHLPAGWTAAEGSQLRAHDHDRHRPAAARPGQRHQRSDDRR